MKNISQLFSFILLTSLLPFGRKNKYQNELFALQHTLIMIKREATLLNDMIIYVL